ncbi:29618_t:CDS:2 [Gigaspora margarita]|uniref:29618_t:CDS:1 n=1 Tax=Gigaspora margarita TaxID=4874 RepID=A0ABN7VZV6_GIGMA|nr:29618_t:CDS:2 [Gigaspora margarita]
MVHAQSYDYDSLKYKLLSFLHSKEDPIKEDSYESDYGVCSDCSRPNTSTDWCHMCNAERFRQGFGTWTSNNEYIDKFIQDAQLGAADRREVLEWIPYEKLKHVTYVARGGYSTIYKAIWVDGPISGWNHEMQQWQRYQFMYDDKCRFLTTLDNMYSGTFGISIALKCLHDSSNVDEEFLNEWKTHLKCYKVGNFSLIRLIGITQDPETSNYMVAMEYAANGSLGDDLKNLIQKNWYVRLRRLLEIITVTLEFIKADKDLERFQNFDKQIFTRHSKACYTSRLISFPGINILPNPQDYSASITALTLDDTIEESEKDHYTL